MNFRFNWFSDGFYIEKKKNRKRGEGGTTLSFNVDEINFASSNLVDSPSSYSAFADTTFLRTAMNLILVPEID